MQLFLVFDDIIPIPECSGLMKMTKFKRPMDLANEMVREVKLWQQKNPDCDVMEIVSPSLERVYKK